MGIGLGVVGKVKSEESQSCVAFRPSGSSFLLYNMGPSGSRCGSKRSGVGGLPDAET